MKTRPGNISLRVAHHADHPAGARLAGCITHAADSARTAGTTHAADNARAAGTTHAAGKTFPAACLRATGRFVPLLLAAALLAGCAAPAGTASASPAASTASATPAPTPAATPAPTPTPEPTPAIKEITVTVDATKRYQQFLGFGGNYTQVQYTEKAQDAIGQYTLENLHPEWVRIPVPLDMWEPVNDNGKADVMDMKGFQTEDPRLVELFELVKRMRAEYGVKNITASVWKVASWMIGEKEGFGGIIPTELYAEVAESMTAFLVHLRDRYGVTIDQIGFNEPDIGTYVKMNPNQMIAFVKVIGPMMKQAGLETKWLIGDVSQPSPTVLFAEALLGDPDIREYLGPVSAHSWNTSTMSDTLLSTIRDFMVKSGKPLIIGEFGYNPGLWKTPAEFPTWQNAWFIANLIHRTVKFTGASVILYWELQNDYPLMSLELEPYPAWYVYKQAFDTLKPGVTIVDCKSADETIVTGYAAADEAGYFTAQLLNRKGSPVRVVLKGVPDGTLKAYVTAEGRNQEDGGVWQAENGTVTLELPPKCMFSLYTP